MRILHVVPSYLPATRYGGPIHAVHGLARALVGLGHEVHVFTTSVDGDADSDVPHGRAVVLDGVRVWYFRVPRLRRLYYAPEMRTELATRIRGFDLVHLHSVFLWPTSMAARLAHAARVPYVLSPRGMLVRDLIARRSPVTKAAWLGLVERATLAQAAATHLTSAQELSDARALPLPLRAPFVIENGVDLPEPGFSERASERVRALAASGSYALYLGRVHWKKGLARALEALATTSIRLVICGPDDEGFTEKLERVGHEQGVSAQVRFEGPVGGDDKWALLAAARFVILPSDNENFGNVVLEAMAVGRPVVVTERVGASTLVRDAEAGLVCAADPGALREAMQALWGDVAAADAHGQAGRAYVRERFGWPRVAARMVEAYSEIAARARAGR
jgi:glycosyltransferase involved in cell wall biosynthesis